MVSRRACDDLGELFESEVAEASDSVLGAAFCFLDFADGGVEGAIAFSPLVLGLRRPLRCSGSETASLVALVPVDAGTSLKIEESDGLTEAEVWPIVLLLYVGLDFMVEPGA